MTIPEVCRLAKEGAHTIAYSTEEEKNKMLTLAADALIQDSAKIIAENHEDVITCTRGAQFQDRLMLNEQRIAGIAEGLKKLILRLREKRFDPSTGQREYQFLLTEEFVSLLTAEKYGMLLIMEQAKGTRYEGLRASLIDMLAAKTAPMLADEDNSMLLAQIMARNLIDGMVMVLKNRVRPREIPTNLNRLVEYHTKGIDALLK